MSVQLPSDFNVHKRLESFHIANRLKGIEADNIDWATAEAMALGSLNLEGYNTRIIGEDVERGTFNHRHVVFTDQKHQGKTFTPLQYNLNRNEHTGRFGVFNTNLNEVGTMAYEYGYSLESPKNLCMWEAQFGDFYNPAQMIVDQYLMCSEAKWMRQSGLILLLPHGFDGAGPEHSTCHIERFLQNVNSNAYDTTDSSSYKHLNAFNVNFQVANMTTPANYFHILRRQMHRNFRKPLVIAAPKVGLKHPLAVSPVEDMANGTSFQPIITNNYGQGDAEHVVLCSGKVFFDIHAKLSESSKPVKVIRVEELAPFPSELIEKQLAGVKKNVPVTWVQDECMNEGAFQFAKLHVDRMIENLDMDELEMGYIGRKSAHSFVTGAGSDYKKQNEHLWNDFKQKIIE